LQFAGPSPAILLRSAQPVDAALTKAGGPTPHRRRMNIKLDGHFGPGLARSQQQHRATGVSKIRIGRLGRFSQQLPPIDLRKIQ
jgi:hypothetical protein